MHLLDDTSYIIHLEAQAAAQRRLIRWLAIPYGENTPIFHGQYKEELLECYRDALAEEDGDAAYFVAGEWVRARPEPGEDVDLGDQVVETVMVDERGNTVH